MKYLFMRFVSFCFAELGIIYAIPSAISTIVTAVKPKALTIIITLLLWGLFFGKFIHDKGVYLTPDKGAEYCSDTGHYYKAYDNSIDWEGAKEKCEEKGGYLATVTSQAEYDFLASICNIKYFYWLGGRKEGESFRWITGEDWVFGKPHNYPWLQGQPDDRSGIDDTDGQFFLSYEPIDGGWDDKQMGGDAFGKNSVRDGGAGYVCEWD